MSDAITPRSDAPAEALDRRIRRSWLIFACSFIALASIVLLRLGTEGGSFLDWSLVDTHFDLLDAGRRVTVAEPWPVRPGVLVALGLEL